MSTITLHDLSDFLNLEDDNQIDLEKLKEGCKLHGMEFIGRWQLIVPKTNAAQEKIDMLKTYTGNTGTIIYKIINKKNEHALFWSYYDAIVINKGSCDLLKIKILLKSSLLKEFL